MAETVSNLFLKARALLDQYTEDGVLIPEAEVIDIQKKFIPLIDIAHKELYEIAKIDEEQEEPTTLTLITDTTEVNYKADQALVFYGACFLATKGNKSLVNFFREEYEKLKKRCSNKAQEEAIEDYYSS